MFYSQFILAKKGPLGTIWIAAHLERKLRKNQVADTDIGISVDSILSPDVPIALRLSSHLLLGVVRIYSRKVNYLFHDCSEALLKVKQAFRSSAVDLPPEESTAPYHAITLPETFHLDDFELPDTAFQGDYVDHHISSKEQITLQDNPERTGYSTSQFGLDERFGDGSSHIGVDLEEELLKDHSTQLLAIQIGSYDGTFQGQTPGPLTGMDIDETEGELGMESCGRAEGAGNMASTSNYNKHENPNLEDLGRNNDLPSWGGYNIQTPDLNEMFFGNQPIEGPSTVYNEGPPTVAMDDVMSPGLIECAQAPATPGLLEETVPSRAHESPVLSPQGPSPSNNGDSIKCDGSTNHMVNDGNGVMAFEQEHETAEVGQALNSEAQILVAHHGADEFVREDKAADNSGCEMPHSVVNDQLDDAAPNGQAPSTLSIEESCVSTPIHNPLNVSELMYQPLHDNTTVEAEMAPTKSLNAEASVGNTSEICSTVSAVPQQGEHSEHTDGTFQNKDYLPSLASGADGQNGQLLDFPEPERMLCAPNVDSYQVSELGQGTAEKGTIESDGSVNRVSTVNSKKRGLADSSQVYQRQSRPRVMTKSLVDFFVPGDDDLLASILVGKKIPGLAASPASSLMNSSAKRPRLTPKVTKRKALVDDTMVLHADVIRQQLMNTEDIRRVRRKAPCTRAEVWMIEKGSLEDEIFFESIFPDFGSIQYQPYRNDSTQQHECGPLPGPALNSSAPIADVPVQTGTSGAAEMQESSNTVTSSAKELSSSTKPLLDISNSEQCAATDAVDTNEPCTTAVSSAQAQSTEVVLDANNEEHLTEITPLDSTAGVDHIDASKDVITSEAIEASCHNENSILGETVMDGRSPVIEEPLTAPGASGLNDASIYSSSLAADVGGAESTQAGCFSSSQPALDDQNNFPTIGETSEFQGNSITHGSGIEMEMDFAAKEDCIDFGSVIEGVDTDFLNADDDDDFEAEANTNVLPPTGEFHSLENAGWSSRTRGVARYLRVIFDDESGHGRKSVAIDHLLRGKTKKEASRMFFETLVLKTRDYIQVEQERPFDLVNVKPGAKLMKSEF